MAERSLEGAAAASQPGDPPLSATLPRGRWRAWLDRRVPPRRVVRLDQRNVFIFPPRAGLAFLLLVVVLVLAAINYQNSLIFGLAFLLASLFAVTIGHTFRNLAGLEIEGAGVDPVFCGEHALFRIRIARRGSRHHHAVRIGWPGEAPQVLDLDEETELRVRVPVAAGHRGWLDPGRLRIETSWPLGILRAWTWVDLDQRALVYPRPLSGAPPEQGATGSGDSDVVLRGGSDDFLGLREYRPGDSLKHIAWKSWAHDGELMVKEFGGHADRRILLDWDALPGVDTETRLSLLCGWVLELEAAGEAWGLRLPDAELEPGRGEGHRETALRMLATFGLSRPSAHGRSRADPAPGGAE